MDNRVIHFEIQADDVSRAKKFYEKAFGWKIEQMMTENGKGGMNYWGITTGENAPGINGGLYSRADGDEKRYLYDCTILVEDIEKAMTAVKSGGGTITKGKMEIPEVGLFASAKDTEGNRFGIMQAVGWKPK